MASISKVGIDIVVNAHQGLSMFLQLAQAANKTHVNVNSLNKSLAQSGSQLKVVDVQAGKAKKSLHGIFAGIGAYALARGALRASIHGLTEITKISANLELAQQRLQLVTGANPGQMKQLLSAAELAGAAVGPLATGDIIELQERLGRVIGANIPLVASFTDKMAMLASNVMIFSKGKVDADTIGRTTQQLMNAFGGFTKGEDYMKKMLQYFEAATLAYSPDDPGMIAQKLKSSMGTLRAAGAPLDQIFQLAILTNLVPTGGQRAAGRDIAQLYTYITKDPNSIKKERVEAMKNLGLFDSTGKSVVWNSSGGTDILQFIVSMQKAINTARSSLSPADFTQWLTRNLNTAFEGQELAGRLAKTLALPESLQQWADMVSKVNMQLATSPEKRAEILQSGSWGAWEKITSDLETVIGNIFRDPNTYLARTLVKVGEGTGALIKYLQSTDSSDHSTQFKQFGWATILSGISSLALMVGGLMLTSLKSVFAGTILAWAGELAGWVGITLASLGVAAAIASVLGAVVLAGIYLYDSSPGFKTAVDFLAESYLRISYSISDALRNGLNNYIIPALNNFYYYVGGGWLWKIAGLWDGKDLIPPIPTPPWQQYKSNNYTSATGPGGSTSGEWYGDILGGASAPVQTPSLPEPKGDTNSPVTGKEGKPGRKAKSSSHVSGASKAFKKRLMRDAVGDMVHELITDTSPGVSTSHTANTGRR